jgi:cytochrome c-type biogenesis protein CcmH
MTKSVQSLQKQLKQLRQRLDSGSLDQARYDQARAPLERQLLDLMVHAPDAAEPAAVASGTPPRRAGVQTWALLGGVALVVAAVGYSFTGAPDAINQVPGQVAAGGDGQGASHDMSSEQMATLVQKLAERMQANPDDAEGWVMLGRSYAAMGRAEDALGALAKAVKLSPKDPGVLADFADAMAVKNNRTLEGEPLQLIERALQIDPSHLKSLVLAGTAAFNRDDYAKAVSYWDRAVQVGPADNPMVQIAQSGAAEARERGKLPPPAANVAPAPGAAVEAAAAPGGAATVAAAEAAAAAGPPARITGIVDLSPALRAKVTPEDAVFVYARAAEGSRMPLALVRRQVKDLPLSFTLDDSLAMSPAARLSGASKVVVGARITKSGQAMSQPGDLEATSAPMGVVTDGVTLTISSEVK